MPPDFQPIVPAAPAFSPAGTLYSPQFDDVYSSSQGTLAQAQHVFLNGNGLPDRWHKSSSFTIVETGFGAGFNFLAAWQALRESAPAGVRLHFVSVEKHPFQRVDLEQIHGRQPALQALSAQLLERYPPLLPGFHRLHFDGGRVTLTLLFGEAAAMLRQLQAKADAFFLDGFAPSRNPQMWSGEVFAQLARLANPGATLATYTVAAAVCHGLNEAGFEVEKRPGFASKREMLCGRFRGAAVGAAHLQDRRAIVIGAGLAGTSCAQRLAARGWGVQLIERHQAPAQEASGNPAALVRPVFSLDWNTHSRFTSAGFLYAMRHENQLARSGGGSIRGEGGVLQFARNADRFAKQQQVVGKFALPEDLVKIISATEAAELAGVKVAGPASWFPGAFWANPASMCRANLDASTGKVDCRFGRDVAGLRKSGGFWEALDRSGQVIASAPVAILANAYLAQKLSQGEWLPLRPVRGQVSLMRERADRKLRIAVCGDGYVTPADGGMHCFGASFNEDMAEEGIRIEDHAANLRRLESMLPGFGDGVAPEMLDGRVAFRAMSVDRLPVVGALADPRLPDADSSDGLFACLALGSRGMTWAALAAEIVASRVAGEPLPVESGLLDAVDAGRFAKGRHAAAAG